LPERALSLPGRVALPEIGRVVEATIVDVAEYAVPRVVTVAAFDADALPACVLVRGRRLGDRVIASDGTERRLKTLLIGAKIPRWDRVRVPVVEAGGEIVWIAGLRRSAIAPITPATRRVVRLALVHDAH
jgi:tRNA(Ile)-lysidine synthase